MTFYYLSKIKQRAVVFVNSDFLKQQWYLRAKKFCKEEIVFIDEETLPEIVKNGLTGNIYCITIQFFNSRKEYLNKFINWDFGIEIIDEAHNYGAETYYPLIEDSIVPRRLALTATFRRQDGLHTMLEFNFGTRYVMENKLPRPITYSFYTGIRFETVIERSKIIEYEKLIQHLESIDVDYVQTKNYLSFKTFDLDYGNLCWKDVRYISRSASLGGITHLESIVTEHRGRHSKVVKLINGCLDAGRYILVLAKRKTYLKKLYAMYKDKYDCTLILGGASVDYSKLSGKRIVFAITQLAREALDVEHLDTLVSVHPLKDTEQAVGRIAREFLNKLQPLFFYVYDNCGISHGMLRASKKYIKINSVYKGDITVPNIKNILHLHS
jgi:superfamily II DNA or RNA helicase